MECISSVKTNVMWGGSRSVFFSPTRGIRQGDPVSPYIFVLCMDKLSHLIMEAVEEGSWHPLKAGKNGPLISHLMFADDLLLFGQATRSEMEGVNKAGQVLCYVWPASQQGEDINHVLKECGSFCAQRDCCCCWVS